MGVGGFNHALIGLYKRLKEQLAKHLSMNETAKPNHFLTELTLGDRAPNCINKNVRPQRNKNLGHLSFIFICRLIALDTVRRFQVKIWWRSSTLCKKITFTRIYVTSSVIGNGMVRYITNGHFFLSCFVDHYQIVFIFILSVPFLVPFHWLDHFFWFITSSTSIQLRLWSRTCGFTFWWYWVCSIQEPTFPFCFTSCLGYFKEVSGIIGLIIAASWNVSFFGFNNNIATGSCTAC